jgi:hypothetical protein
MLYAVLNGGDATAPASTDSFIAWLAPGIPMGAGRFDFAKAGAQLDKKTLAQAAEFARLVNLVPDASAVIDLNTQQATFENKGNYLWTTYNNALQNSQVANGTLTADQEKRLKKFRGLLWATEKRQTS